MNVSGDQYHSYVSFDLSTLPTIQPILYAQLSLTQFSPIVSIGTVRVNSNLNPPYSPVSSITFQSPLPVNWNNITANYLAQTSTVGVNLDIASSDDVVKLNADMLSNQVTQLLISENSYYPLQFYSSQASNPFIRPQLIVVQRECKFSIFLHFSFKKTN